MISAFPETGSDHMKQSRGKTSSPGLLQPLRLRPCFSKSPSTGAFAEAGAGQAPRKKCIWRGMGGLGGRYPLGALVKGGTFPPQKQGSKRTPRAMHGAFVLAYCPTNIMTATWRKAPRHPQARCCPHRIPATMSGPAAGHVPFPRSCGSAPWRPCARSRRAG